MAEYAQGVRHLNEAATSPERLPLVARDTRANLVRAFKASGCVSCKRRYPELDWSDLHLDHIDPRDKPRASVALNGGRGALASSHGDGGGGMAAILAELLLCQVLCADCHREKHRSGSLVERQLTLFGGSGSWRYEVVGS